MSCARPLRQYTQLPQPRLTSPTTRCPGAKPLTRSPVATNGAAFLSWSRFPRFAAEVIGIRPMMAKLSAFAVSSFIVGVAGAQSPTTDKKPLDVPYVPTHESLVEEMLSMARVGQMSGSA